MTQFSILHLIMYNIMAQDYIKTTISSPRLLQSHHPLPAVLSLVVLFVVPFVLAFWQVWQELVCWAH